MTSDYERTCLEKEEGADVIRRTTSMLSSNTMVCQSGGKGFDDDDAGGIMISLPIMV